MAKYLAPHRNLTPEQVYEVLTSGLTDTRMAEKMGCSRSAIRAIRTGQAHPTLFPEIERRISRQVLCDKCIFYSKHGCSLGIPESESGKLIEGYDRQQIGRNYAKLCSAFIRESPAP